MAFDWYHGHRYSLMLLALALLLLLHPLARGVVLGQWLYDVFITLVFLAALLVLFKRKSHRLVAVLLGVPTVLANWTGYVFPGLPSQPLAVGSHLLAALFLGFTVVTILVTIHQAGAVTADSLAGAFSGYLLAGLVFGHAYCILEAVRPGSFHISADLADLAADLADPGRRRAALSYFSFTTLTTVGYGDVVPANPPARELACVEAVTGQFYIAVVMAELIGLKVSQPGGRPRPGAG
jgi:hypothetical protein